MHRTFHTPHATHADGKPAEGMLTLRIKVKDGLGELVAQLNELKK